MNLETDAPFPSPGRLFQFGIKRSFAALRRSIRDGGPIQQWITRRGRQAMRYAATQLPPIPVRAPCNGEPAIALMAGAGFWEQTTFCLHSLLLHTKGQQPPAFLVDDGSLVEYADIINSRFPGIRIFNTAEIHTTLEASLPAGEFPALRGHRRICKRLRRLTDTHGVRPGWNLVLDSNMLFFRRPEAILRWLAAPSGPLVLTGGTDECAYPCSTLEALVNAPLPLRIDTGITGLESTSISWRLFEAWVGSLLLQHGSNSSLERTLISLHLAHTPYQQLPDEDHVVFSHRRRHRNDNAILHYYLTGAKAPYFRHDWRRIQAETIALHD